eukprot:13608222-Alexandrium_andersonii.AAC.1
MAPANGFGNSRHKPMTPVLMLSDPSAARQRASKRLPAAPDVRQLTPGTELFSISLPKTASFSFR